MRFRSKPEAYLYTLYSLHKLATGLSEIAYAEVDVRYLEKIRVAIENHEQDTGQICNIIAEFIQEFKEFLTVEQENKLNQIKQAVDNKVAKQEESDKWKNPLARRFESQMHIELLQQPTAKMMQAVALVSNRIAQILEKNEDLHESFMETLMQEYHIIAFGSFSKRPKIDEVITILQQNKAANLQQIMHMHFKFARDIIYQVPSMRDININYDDRIFSSENYNDRGRQDNIKLKYTNKMGIMTNESDDFNIGLPTSTPAWVSDSKAQAVDFKSSFARSFLDNDTPYVAGPSGMTSRFVAQMLAFSDVSDTGDALKTKGVQRSYILAVTAYMVSAGFHSLHEVLWPIASCLPEENLLPNYNTELKEPANFNQFYSLIASIDDSFTAIRQSAWAKMLKYFEEVYVPKYMSASHREDTGVDLTIQRISKQRLAFASFDNYRLSERQVTELAALIMENNSLTRLSLFDCKISKEDYPRLIAALGENTSIKYVTVNQGIFYKDIKNAVKKDKGGSSKLKV